MLEFRQITDTYAVAGQITADQVEEIKRAGFQSVICNRPDGEQPGQPTADSIRAAVEAAGLAFRHIPFTGSSMTAQVVADQASALDELEGPVFAYCRSGARCTNIYAAIQQSHG